jgi:hypothetical protein
MMTLMSTRPAESMMKTAQDLLFTFVQVDVKIRAAETAADRFGGMHLWEDAQKKNGALLSAHPRRRARRA